MITYVFLHNIYIKKQLQSPFLVFMIQVGLISYITPGIGMTITELEYPVPTIIIIGSEMDN